MVDTLEVMTMTHVSGWGCWRSKDGQTLERWFGVGAGSPMCMPFGNLNDATWKVTRDIASVNCPRCLEFLSKYDREDD